MLCVCLCLCLYSSACVFVHIKSFRLRHLSVANSVRYRSAIDDVWQLHSQIRFSQANTAIAIFQMENPMRILHEGKDRCSGVWCVSHCIALMSSSTLDSNSNCYVISIEYLCVCSIPKFSVKCGTAMGIWHHFELLPSVLDVIVATCSLQNTITLDTIAFCWLTKR